MSTIVPPESKTGVRTIRVSGGSGGWGSATMNSATGLGGRASCSWPRTNLYQSIVLPRRWNIRVSVTSSASAWASGLAFTHTAVPPRLKNCAGSLASTIALHAIDAARRMFPSPALTLRGGTHEDRSKRGSTPMSAADNESGSVDAKPSSPARNTSAVVPSSERIRSGFETRDRRATAPMSKES